MKERTSMDAVTPKPAICKPEPKGRPDAASPPMLLALTGGKSTTPPIAPATDDDPEPTAWGADDPDLVINSQPPIRVFVNDFDAIVIMMESYDPYEDDPFVFVRPENLPK